MLAKSYIFYTHAFRQSFIAVEILMGFYGCGLCRRWQRFLNF